MDNDYDDYDEKDDDYSQDYNDEYDDYNAGYNSEEEKEKEPYIDTQPELVLSYEARERMTTRDFFNETVIAGVGAEAQRLQQIQKRARRQDLDPEDKFLISFNAYAAIYKSMLDITDEEIKYIRDNVYRMKNVGYKNPAGILFGYYILDGVEINKQRLKEVFNLLPRVNDKDDISITKPDIIRYARFWINFIKY
jgi:hypothetical protein